MILEQQNNEFQWYVADDDNSFAKDGKLHIKPTLTANKIGYDTINKGHVRLDDCTDENKANCERQASGNVIVNPVRSARLTTEKSFSFKYGRVEVIAKIPQGDWLWPGKNRLLKKLDNILFINFMIKFANLISNLAATDTMEIRWMASIR